MDMTPARWFAGVAIGCAAVAAMLLPYPRVSPRSWAPPPPEPLAGALTRLGDAAADVQAAVRAYRASQGLARWSAAAGASSGAVAVRIDSSVPESVAAVARAAASTQWTRLGSTTSAAHAEVFVYVDSTTIPRSANATASRVVIEPRRLVDVRFALPEATDGERCVVLVRLRGTTPAHVAALRDKSIAGICGFFAAFGRPGSGVRQWLSSIDYAVARQSDWDVARAPSIDASAVYGLDESGSRCLTGRAGACVAALGVTLPPSRRAVTATVAARTDWVFDDVRARGVGTLGPHPKALGDAETRFLADAVRDLGPERFARFWQSGDAPDAAFAAAAGTSLEAWTHGWLSRTYGAVSHRPGVRRADVLWLAAALPLLLVVAARPRERVLAETAFRANR